MSKEKKLYIKGFNKDLKCRGFQFEVGKEYKIDLPEGYKLTENDLCSDKVFHFCDSLENVHIFYNCTNKSNRYCVIEALGDIVKKDDKCGSNYIRIVREIRGKELKQLKGLTNGNSGLFNSGYDNTGCGNSGHHNSNDWNSGSYNSGNFNSGCFNSGNYNSGYWNSGNYNSGYFNSGLFNSCNYSNGVFCSEEPKISIFNIPTDMTMNKFLTSKYYRAICSSRFELTERKDGQLIEISFKYACKKWWDNMTDKNKEIIKSMPNFNINVFCKITGINRKDV